MAESTWRIRTSASRTRRSRAIARAILSSTLVVSTDSSRSASVNRRHAVRPRKIEELVRCGKARVVAGLTESVVDGVFAQRAGPRGTDARAARRVQQHPYAHARGRRAREVLDRSLVRADFGLHATGEVDLELLVALNRFEKLVRSFEQVTHAAAPPIVIELSRMVA